MSSEAAEVLFSASEVGVGTEIGESGEDEALWSILFFGLPVPLLSLPPEDGRLCCRKTGVLFFLLFLFVFTLPPFEVVIFTSSSDIFSLDFNSSREKAGSMIFFHRFTCCCAAAIKFSCSVVIIITLYFFTNNKKNLFRK